MHTSADKQISTTRILLPGIRLAFFIGIMVFAVSSVHLLTRDTINAERQRAAEELLYEIAGPGTVRLVEVDTNHYLTTDSAHRTGQIVRTSTQQGYNGEISLWVGINYLGEITNVRVIEHRETPGLGDRIDLDISDWVLGFNGKSLTAPGEQFWQVKKDGGYFDQFTGATITPRAVVGAVHETLLQYKPSDQPVRN